MRVITTLSVCVFAFVASTLALPSNLKQYAVEADDSIFPTPDPEICGNSSAGLNVAMREIVELIPVMNLTTIFLTYNSRDEQVQSLVEFLSSGVFTSMGEDLRNMEEYHRLVLTLCYDLNFDLIFYVNFIRGAFGIPEIEPITTPAPISTELLRDDTDDPFFGEPGIAGMFQLMASIIPTDEIVATIGRLLVTDEYFRQFAALLRSDDMIAILTAATEREEFQIGLQFLRDSGIDIDCFLKQVGEIFDWPLGEECVEQ